MDILDYVGKNSMLARGLLAGSMQTVNLQSIDPNAPGYLDWVEAFQGNGFDYAETTEMDTAGSTIQGGIHVVDFGAPAFTFAGFLHVALNNDGQGDGDQVLRINIRKLLAAIGMGQIQATQFLAIGHGYVNIDGNQWNVCHVIGGLITGEMFLQKIIGQAEFAEPIIGQSFVEMQIACQFTA